MQVLDCAELEFDVAGEDVVWRGRREIGESRKR